MEQEETKSYDKGKRKDVTKVVKETKKKTVKNVIEMLLDMIPKFIDHIFNIVHQYRTISDLKKT